jgi:hypothetical protein
MEKSGGDNVSSGQSRAVAIRCTSEFFLVPGGPKSRSELELSGLMNKFDSTGETTSSHTAVEMTRDADGSETPASTFWARSPSSC